MADWQRKFENERDRRYSDLRAADQRALQIKETADATALVLAAQLQAEKDERKNDVLARWDVDRNTFLTRAEYANAHQNLVDRMDTAAGNTMGKVEQLERALNLSQGASGGIQRFRQNQTAIITLVIAVAAIIVTFVVFHH
jgi:hypothetical protein